MHPMLILMIVIGTPGPNGRLSLPARTNILLAVVYNVGVYQGIRTHQIPSFFCMRKRFLIGGNKIREALLSARRKPKCAGSRSGLGPVVAASSVKTTIIPLTFWWRIAETSVTDSLFPIHRPATPVIITGGRRLGITPQSFCRGRLGL